MLYNNKIRILVNLLSLALISPTLYAQEAPAVAGSWLSILPPLVAIAVALVIRKVISSLFLGLWLGAWLVQGFSLEGLWLGLLDSFQRYVTNALADNGHASVILFSLMIGGMVGIISRNGGMQGIVNRIVNWADTVRHARLATAWMGIAIFFDDYANTLVVGNTMRPVTDAKRISREKLAYIVDSTAAPVACIAVVTTWIGYEVGLIGESISQLPGLQLEAYLVFLNTIPYSFYPVLAIAFVFMVAASGRDFGPMLDAERRAWHHGVKADGHLSDSGGHDSAPVEPVAGKPQRAMNAIIPVAVLIGSVMVGLYVTGKAAVDLPDPGIQDIIGSADSYKALMWGSFLSVLAAAALTLFQRIMDLEEIINAWYRGLRSMLMAIIILLLAWSLGEITTLLETSVFLESVLGDNVPAFALPALIFLVSALTAFATGSSWGAMGILLPLAIPTTWAVLQSSGMSDPQHLHILYSAIAAVLAGSVWGDHCSPISDTTILSSLASDCDHIEHVRTQLPYALVVGLVAILAGSLPVAMGLPWWLGMATGLILLWVILRTVGRPDDSASD